MEAKNASWAFFQNYFNPRSALMKQAGTEPCMSDGGQVSISRILFQPVPNLHTIKWLSKGFLSVKYCEYGTN